jgi:hypothetical protein
MLEKAIEKFMANNSDFIGSLIKKQFRLKVTHERGIVSFSTFYGNTLICEEKVDIKAVLAE